MEKVIQSNLKGIILLGLIILGGFYLYNKITDDFREEKKKYENTIKSINNKIDSIHGLNKDLVKHIDSLNLEIKSLDSLIIKKDDSIKNLRNEKKSKVSAVDSFTDDELLKFFTERYRQHIDSLTQRNSKIGS